MDAKKLGGKALAESVMILENGRETTLDQLTSGVIRSNDILYARTNWAGKVDLIVLGSISGNAVYYGRAVVSSRNDTWIWNADKGKNEPKVDGVNGHNELDDEGNPYWVWKDGCGPYAEQLEGVNGYYTQKRTLEVQCGTKSVGPYEMSYAVDTGEYVAVTIGTRGTEKYFSSVTKLTELRSVPNSAWSGSTAVTVDGQTYRVSADVPCYNKDTGTWMTLSEAHAYASAANLYVKDGAVRVIEVKHS